MASGVLHAYDALLFDLDGVITRTAAVHAEAWKALFDEFLERRSRERGEPVQPFDIERDYLAYIDGKRRYDGVASFLTSRRIELPWGDRTDGPEVLSVCGLGNRKDRYFMRLVEERGVEVFDDAVALLDGATEAGLAAAVVSASDHCDDILSRVGLLDRFAARVTGREATAWELRGKPAPDTFLKAAELVTVPPARAVVLEDAIAGVQAGRAGRFGLVVGVDRHDTGDALAANGADMVVTDLRQLLD